MLQIKPLSCSVWQLGSSDVSIAKYGVLLSNAVDLELPITETEFVIF